MKNHSEKSIQDEIIKELKKLGLFVWRNNTGRIPLAGKKSFKTRMVVVGMEGMPDILGYLPNGRGFAIEVKRDESKQPTEMQKLRIRQLTKTNVEAFVAHDVQKAVGRIQLLLLSEGMI